MSLDHFAGTGKERIYSITMPNVTRSVSSEVQMALGLICRFPAVTGVLAQVDPCNQQSGSAALGLKSREDLIDAVSDNVSMVANCGSKRCRP
jgi:hypothetical protein